MMHDNACCWSAFNCLFKCSNQREADVMEVWTHLLIVLILTIKIIITFHTGNVDHDILITLTLSEDRMEIKKKQQNKKNANKILVCQMSVITPNRRVHLPTKKHKTRKNNTCLLRVISQVDEIFQNKQTKILLRIVQV